MLLHKQQFSPPQRKTPGKVVEMCLSDGGAYISVQVRRTHALNSYRFIQISFPLLLVKLGKKKNHNLV